MKRLTIFIIGVIFFNLLGSDLNIKSYEESITTKNEVVCTLEQYKKSLENEYDTGFKSKNLNTINERHEIKSNIYKALMNGQASYVVPNNYSLLVGDVNDVFQKLIDMYFEVLNENPDTFFASLTITVRKGANYELVFGYCYNKEEREKMLNNLKNKVVDIKEKYLIKNPENNQEINLKNEYIIHDYIINNCQYDTEGYYSNDISVDSHTAYGALMKGSAVCDGYAKACKYLLDQCGIESGIVESTNHAWNYINLNGQYYHLDLTWDDPVSDRELLRYTYFNVSTNELKLLDSYSDHDFNENLYPVCNSEVFRFLRENDDFVREDETIYYNNSLGNLYKMNLLGENKQLINSNFNKRSFVVSDKDIYYLNKETGTNDSMIKWNTLKDEKSTIATNLNGVYYLGKKDNNILCYGVYGRVVTSIPVPQKQVEDINEDGIVDLQDLAIVAKEYNMTQNNSLWNSKYDVNKDGIIDILDYVAISIKL